MRKLYVRIDTDEETPVQCVGVHPLRWRPEWGEPSAMFYEAETVDIAQLPQVRALAEALEALEKRMWRSGAGTVGFKWCTICGRSDLDTGKIGHKSDCPFAALAASEEVPGGQ